MKPLAGVTLQPDHAIKRIGPQEVGHRGRVVPLVLSLPSISSARCADRAAGCAIAPEGSLLAGRRGEHGRDGSASTPLDTTLKV